MYDLAGFPHPPNDVINAVKAAEDVSVAVASSFFIFHFGCVQVYVAVNITEEEFVRVAVGIENPDGAVVRKFGNARTQEVEVTKKEKREREVVSPPSVLLVAGWAGSGDRD